MLYLFIFVYFCQVLLLSNNIMASKKQLQERIHELEEALIRSDRERSH